MDNSSDHKPKKTARLTAEQALVKIRAWCAYQERCNQDVRSKLFDWGFRGEVAEQLIAQLISEGFLNEERYAKTFAGGKFRIKKWGKRKIIQELKKKNISEPCIRKGLAGIDEKEYIATLTALLEKKKKEIKESNVWQRKAKLSNFLIGKGFEPELVYEIMREMNA